MKTFKYITAAIALGFAAIACQTLDLEPKGLIYENVLLSSDNGVKKYLALAYQDLPIEDFNYGQNGDQRGYATGMVETSGRPRSQVLRLQQLRHAVVDFHTVTAGDIGHMTVSATLIT